MGVSNYSDIKDSLRHLYLDDPRPWLVGFSAGKDTTMLALVTVKVVVEMRGPRILSPQRTQQGLSAAVSGPAKAI